MDFNTNPDKSHFLYYKIAKEIIKKHLPYQPLNSSNKEDLLNNLQFLALMKVFPGIVSILDLSTLQYLYMSENVKNFLGYTAKEFYAEGLQKAISLFTEVHNEVLHKNVIPIMFDFLERHSALGDICDLRISFNYSLNRKDGTVGHYLQQANVIHTDETGKAQIILYLITDISDIKKDNNITISVSKKDNNEIYHRIFSKHFPETQEVLSDREFEILNLLSQGKSSSEVGDLLCISENTVYKHRKNMLKKMDAKNTGELLAKAFSYGLI